MNDLERLEKYYKEEFLVNNYWQDFNCYPFYLSQTQYRILIQILKDFNITSAQELSKKSILDVGAGEGNLLLSFLKLGANIRNITAIEMLDIRFDRLKTIFANAEIINNNYLNYSPNKSFDIITIMAVLSSILDEKIRDSIVKKAYNELNSSGLLIIYDYNSNNPKERGNYKPVSFKKIINILDLKKPNYKVFRRCYINARIGKLLCVMGFGSIIPFIQTFKVFNEDYSYLLIRK